MPTDKVAAVPVSPTNPMAIGDIMQLTSGGPMVTVTAIYPATTVPPKPATCDVRFWEPLITGDFKSLPGLPQACYRRVNPE